MRRRLQSNNTIIFKLVMVGIVAIAGGFLLTSFLGSKSETQALSATEFQAGRIIDDSVFYNPNTMTAAEIDAFIDSHTPACDMWGKQKINGITRAEHVKQLRAQGQTKYHDPPFVCISEYYENPTTHKTNFSTGGRKEAGMLSAGEIIYQAAHKYNINPQVLLVMLKKESYVWGDDWPHDFQYNTVMGYACPDGAPCDSKYFGFYNQVMMAAWQLNYYRDHIYSYNYRPYTTNNILYNPDRSCGSKSVYLENIATTSLYIYTPYVPNDAALANYPGTSWCGSYGNRNFYMYFREWFGSTLEAKKASIEYAPGSYFIVPNSSFSDSLMGADDSIVVSTRTNDDSEVFVLSRNNNGTYKIKQKSSGLFISASGQEIQLQKEADSKSQDYYIHDNDDGTFSIALASNSILLLTINNSTKKLSLQYKNHLSDASQSFRFIPDTAFVADGIYRIVSHSNQNRTLDVSGGLFKTGSNIHLWDENTTFAQRFYLRYDSQTGSYEILAFDKNYALDVAGGSTASGANIQIWGTNDTLAQRWTLVKNPDGSMSFLGLGSGKALDISGGHDSPGTNIHTWTINNSSAQKWDLVPMPENSERIADGYYTLSNSSGFVTTNNAGLLQNGTPLTLAESGAVLQFTYNSNVGYYSINLPSTKYALDVRGGSVIPGTIVQLFDSNNTSSQYWSILKNPDGSYRILSARSNLALESSSSTIMTNMQNSSQSQSWTLTSGEAPLVSGRYLIKSSKSPSFALDVSGGAFKNGKNIHLWSSNSTNAQLFSFEQVPNSNSYVIKSFDSSKVLDVSNGGTANGTNIQIWNYDSRTCAQRWNIRLNEDSTYTFLNLCSGKALDLSGGSLKDGSNIQIWDDNHTSAQKWILEKAE